MTTIDYKCEFDERELDGIRDSHDKHGFAIVKQMLPRDVVELLKDEVRRVLEPEFTDKSILTRTAGAFIEQSPVLTRMMAYEPLMRIARYLHHDRPITLNRSAAIYKKPGAAAGVKNSGAHEWHTDWEPLEHPYGSNGVLNTTGASSFWFYLTGSNPHNGGLAIIPDSHTEDWPGPEGFELMKRRRSFYPRGTEPKPYGGMDVPGSIPVITEPGDLVIFAERTYHGVHPHNGDAPRLSCAFSFRPKAHPMTPSWPLPESARRFIESCPSELRHLVEGYIGIDHSWVSSQD